MAELRHAFADRGRRRQRLCKLCIGSAQLGPRPGAARMGGEHNPVSRREEQQAQHDCRRGQQARERRRIFRGHAALEQQTILLVQHEPCEFAHAAHADRLQAFRYLAGGVALLNELPHQFGLVQDAGGQRCGSRSLGGVVPDQFAQRGEIVFHLRQLRIQARAPRFVTERGVADRIRLQRAEARNDRLDLGLDLVGMRNPFVVDRVLVGRSPDLPADDQQDCRDHQIQRGQTGGETDTGRKTHPISRLLVHPAMMQHRARKRHAVVQQGSA